MTTERLDEETLAAFLDGTLAGPERARVLRVLATQPDAYGEFLDAAQVAAEVNASAGVTPIGTRRRPWRRTLALAGPFLAAAGIAGVILLRSPGAPDTIDLMQGARLATVSGAGSIDGALGSNWDEPGWTVVRGDGGSGATAGTAARVGARVAQLEYAAAASDSVAWQRVSATLRDLLGSLEGAGPVMQQLRGDAVSGGADLARLARQLRTLSGAPAAFDLGAWLETARLAAASQRPEFFRPEGEAIASLRAVTAALGRERPAGEGWSRVLAHVRTIQSQGGGDLQGIRLQVDSAIAALPR